MLLFNEHNPDLLLNIHFESPGRDKNHKANPSAFSIAEVCICCSFWQSGGKILSKSTEDFQLSTSSTLLI